MTNIRKPNHKYLSNTAPLPRHSPNIIFSSSYFTNAFGTSSIAKLLQTSIATRRTGFLQFLGNKMNNSQMLETEIRSILTMGIARMESFGAHVLPLSSGGPQDEVDRQLRLFWAYGTIQAALMDLTVAKPPAPAPALGPEGAVLPPPIPEETSYEGYNCSLH